jgi:hypothetical protein
MKRQSIKQKVSLAITTMFIALAMMGCVQVTFDEDKWYQETGFYAPSRQIDFQPGALGRTGNTIDRVGDPDMTFYGLWGNLPPGYNNTFRLDGWYFDIDHALPSQDPRGTAKKDNYIDEGVVNGVRKSTLHTNCTISYNWKDLTAAPGINMVGSNFGPQFYKCRIILKTYQYPSYSYHWMRITVFTNPGKDDTHQLHVTLEDTDGFNGASIEYLI